MSTLHALLVFVGIPLLIFVVITLLVMAPSLAKGPRYRPSQQWDADAEWFGFPGVEGSAGSRTQQIEPSSSSASDKPQDTTGGASARW